MIPSLIVTPEESQKNKKGFAQVVTNNHSGQKSLHAQSFFGAGDLICSFSAGTVSETASYLTVQTGEKKHITLQPEFLQYINHSCDPNVFFDTTCMKIIALKAIQPGDELTFFYPSTEWDMAQPFDCHCGSEKCLRRIQGAAYLNDADLRSYRLTDFIAQQLQKRKKK
ncbi:MAG: hypothetical protein NVSMB63_16670 [Sediminibacterium sp.]